MMRVCLILENLMIVFILAICMKIIIKVNKAKVFEYRFNGAHPKYTFFK